MSCGIHLATHPTATAMLPMVGVMAGTAAQALTLAMVMGQIPTVAGDIR